MSWASRAFLLQSLSYGLELVLERRGCARRAARWPWLTGIRQVGLVQVDVAGHPLTVTVGYPPRNADDNGVRRHVAHDDRARADPAAVADLEGADDLGAGADDDVVAAASDGASRASRLVPPSVTPCSSVTFSPTSAVSPMTTPMPWSMKRPGPSCAAGWISMPGDEARHVRQEAGGNRPAAPPHRVGRAGETPARARPDNRAGPRAVERAAGSRSSDGPDVARRSIEHRSGLPRAR